MNVKSRRFKAVDIGLLLGAILPLVAGMVIKILTATPAEGIQISGAHPFFTIPMPVQDLVISEAQVNSWLVIITILFLCLYLTHGMAPRPVTRRQLVVEWVVEKCRSLVEQNMGDYFSGYVSFVIAIMALSGLSSLLSLIGLFPPTSDVNVVAGWSILVFGLITYYKLKCGLVNYLLGFTEPLFILLPLNILGEVATPLSMAFRHYGNVLSGSVIAVLVAAALQGLSSLLLSWLPGILGDFPLFQIGIPAILSMYFDIFGSCLQAFIFAMLTMLNISGAFSLEDYEKHKKIKLANKKLANKNK